MKFKEGEVEFLDKLVNGSWIYELKYGTEIFFTKEEFINLDWLKSKIKINPKLKHRYHIEIDDIAKNILKCFSKQELQTLNCIYLIYQPKDFFYIANQNNDELPDYQSFWLEQVGLMWHQKQCIFINMRLIEKLSKESSLTYSEFLNEFSIYGFYITLFHELRHLYLDTNATLRENVEGEQIEESVERYAINLVTKYKSQFKTFEPIQANI